MSHGIGRIQREIKRILQLAFDAEIGMVTFAGIRAVFIMKTGGDPEVDRLNPHFERSLKRSLKALVNSRDVVFLGRGGQADPFEYTTVEAFTHEPDTKEAKRVLNVLDEAVGRRQAASPPK